MSKQVLKELNKSLQLAISRLSYYMQTADTMKDVVDLIEGEEGTVEPNTGDYNVTVTGPTGKALGVLERLAELRYDAVKEFPEEAVQWFSTRLISKDGRPDVWFYWTNTECERVQVGTKTEEFPVYEVRCKG